MSAWSMSSSPDHSLRPLTAVARVSRPPINLNDPLQVVLPTFGSTTPFDVAPGHWMPRGYLIPLGGEVCLITFDDEGDVWVTCWVPSVPAIEPWRFVGTIGQPAFQNGWAVANSGFPLRFRKDPLGRVWVTGSASGGTTGTTVFTLPPGHRPAYATISKMLQDSDSPSSWWLVTPDGAVQFNYTTSTVYPDFSFATD
jgi:hypothetical protein